MSKSTDEIIALERRLWTESDDPATLGEIVLDEAITVIEPMGFITKQQAMGMPAEHPWRDVQMTDIVAHQVTDDCVTLAYHGQGRQEGRDEPYRGSIASVYVRRDGRWQLALTAHQPWKPSE
ncbi:MAG TPA: nuclear transport factor 2 family protein [Candidatus Limnocylindria bacterium]|nr:nuclear transport factor 2 family protein [Candidatus Limnocylindria bacterium]